MSQWIPIGRFAQLSGFTVRALRHYESLGLLVPGRVDPGSGYRFYRPEQLPDALRVRLLRALEMPLPDVVNVMSDPESPAALAVLREHRARVASRVGELEQQLARLDEWLHGALQELDASLTALDERASGSAAEDEEPVQPLERAFLGLFGPPGKP
ncbi:MAG: helix-turn-helix domain-containing protein [Myxococcota bacterium]